MEEQVKVVTVPLWFDLTAVFAGSLFGAIHARGRGFDISGMLFLAVCVGLGGGIARDLLLNLRPVAFAKPEYLFTAIGAGIVGLILAERILRVHLLYDLIDGIALGVYTMVGVTKAIDLGVPYVGAIVIGGIAAVAGGIARDILMNHVPEALRPGVPYMTAALLGAGLFALLDWLGVPSAIATPMSVVAIILLRLAALGFGWQTPRPETVSGAVDIAAERTPAMVQQIPGTVMRAPVAAKGPLRRAIRRFPVRRAPRDGQASHESVDTTAADR